MNTTQMLQSAQFRWDALQRYARDNGIDLKAKDIRAIDRDVRIIQKLKDGKNQYVFDLKNGNLGSEGGDLEILLSDQHAFMIYAWSVKIGLLTKVGNEWRLQDRTFVDTSLFPVAQELNLLDIYNGTFKMNVSQLTKQQDLSLKRFYFTPETQQGAAANGAIGVRNNIQNGDGFIETRPYDVILHSQTTKPEVQIPYSSSLENATANTYHVLIYEARGYEVSNVADYLRSKKQDSVFTAL